MSYPVRPQRKRKVAGLAAATIPVLVLCALMWIGEALDTLPGTEFDQNGIYPRQGEGLLGILLAPFLHVGFAHLIANTTAFLVLGALIAWTTQHFWAATVGIVLFGGFGTWLIAQPYTIHVGASGVVYGYAAFLVVWGVLSRRLLNIAVAVGVVIAYGGIVWGVLPGQAGVSWQGHLCGALSGIAMAWWLSRREPRRAFTLV